MEYSDAPLSNYSAGLAAEYRYSPYSGVRLTAGYTGYFLRDLYHYSHNDYGMVQNLSNYSVDYMNIGVDYLFDITTLLQGYARDRKESSRHGYWKDA